MQKYCEFPKKDTTAKKENEWYHFCHKERIPFITVKTRTQLADVHWDYIAYTNDVDAILNSLGNELRDSAIEIFKKFATKKSTFEASGRLVWYRNLEINNARLAAAELFDLISECVAKGNA